MRVRPISSATVIAITIACLLALPTRQAFAQDDSSSTQISFGGSLRVRALYLGNGTLGRELDAATRTALQLSGDDAIDDTQAFLDTRLRLQFSAEVLEEVTAFIGVEVGDITFGVANAGDLGTDGVVFENKNLYLDWHPRRYTFKLRGGLYPVESDPVGLILSNDVAGLHGEVELLGTQTSLYADFIKAVENSRLDLDGDGLIDNDYNDRDIFILGARSSIVDPLALELFLIADIDNTQDTPVANTEQDTYWVGLFARTSIAGMKISTLGVAAYGKRTVTGQAGVHIRGWAVDSRLSYDFPFVNVEAIFGWASGRDPNSTTTDEDFPTITPFYGASGIIYANFGGFNLTGSDLAGTAHTTLKLRTTPWEDFEVEAQAMWAWFTEDRDVVGNGNVNKFNDDARGLGFESNLNLAWKVTEGFKAFARSSIFFPDEGHLVEFDTRRHGALAQVIAGAQLSF